MVRDEIVTIEGTVFDGGNPWPYVNATVKLADVTSAFGARHNFQVIQADATDVWIELAKNPVVEPRRSVTGPWRVLEHHGARPPSLDVADERETTISGEWIETGEPIVVIGYAKAYALVADTGGYREAPLRRPTLVRAIAIGVGADAAAHAKRALARRDREIDARSRPQPRPPDSRAAWLLIGITVLVAIGWLVRWLAIE